MANNTTYTASTIFYPTGVAFPTQLPKVKKPAGCIGGRYGLFAVACSGGKPINLSDVVPLKAELPRYKAFYTNPIQLDRRTGPVKDTTIKDHLKVISKYCGYVHMYHKVSTCPPCHVRYVRCPSIAGHLPPPPLTAAPTAYAPLPPAPILLPLHSIDATSFNCCCNETAATRTHSRPAPPLPTHVTGADGSAFPETV